MQNKNVKLKQALSSCIYRMIKVIHAVPTKNLEKTHVSVTFPSV